MEADKGHRDGRQVDQSGRQPHDRLHLVLLLDQSHQNNTKTISEVKALTVILLKNGEIYDLAKKVMKRFRYWVQLFIVVQEDKGERQDQERDSEADPEVHAKVLEVCVEFGREASGAFLHVDLGRLPRVACAEINNLWQTTIL